MDINSPLIRHHESKDGRTLLLLVCISAAIAGFAIMGMWNAFAAIYDTISKHI